MAEFDRHSRDYVTTLDRSLRLGGGGSSAYYYWHKANYVRALLADPEFSGRILDYGCGVGLLARALHAQLPRAKIDGFDVSDESVQQAAATERVAFTSNAAELGVDYRVIILCNVLHHVPPDDRQALLTEIAARLAPDGRLVIFEHNPWNPATRMVVAGCPFDEKAVLLTRAEAVSRGRAAGLEVVSSDYVLFFPAALSFLHPLERALRWLPLGAQFVVTLARGRA